MLFVTCSIPFVRSADMKPAAPGSVWILVKERTGTSIIMDAIRVYFNPLTSSPDRGKLLAAVRLVDPSVTREQLGTGSRPSGSRPSPRSTTILAASAA